jgi:hypothetical protein
MRPDPNVPYSEWLTEVPPEEAEYYQNIEDYFGRKGGFPWVVRGRDWLTVRSWFEQGIPLTVVYRAIDEFFEKFGREEAPRFLGFVENFVKKHWRLYRAATVGQMAATGWLQQVTPARLAQWLENWAQQLGRSADRARDRGLEDTARVLEKRQASLQRIRRQVPSEGPVTAELIEGLEHKLENFQKTLRRELLRSVPADLQAEWQAQVRQAFFRRLEGYLTERQRQRLLEEAVVRRLWQELQLPDFSLIHYLLEAFRSASAPG